MALPSSIIRSGDRASQPLATAVAAGTLYFVEDEDIIERSDGTNWNAFSASPYSPLGGCMATLNADYTADFSTGTPIPWDGADAFDDSDYHDPAVDNTRLTVPATGIYIITCNIAVANLSTSQFNRLRIFKNGAIFPGMGQQITEVSAAVTVQQSVSCIVPLVAGDYVEAYYDVETDTSETITAAESAFAIYRLA